MWLFLLTFHVLWDIQLLLYHKKTVYEPPLQPCLHRSILVTYPSPANVQNVRSAPSTLYKNSKLCDFTVL